METSTASMAGLAELLTQTGMDCVQAAHLLGLPLALVRGCDDVLYGAYLSAEQLHGMSEAERDDYYRGQRLADAWFYATAEA